MAVVGEGDAGVVVVDYDALSVDELGARLCDGTGPISDRVRSLFYLRTKGDVPSIDQMAKALRQRDHSCLLRHEIAFCLGQIGNNHADDVLTDILSDTTDDPIVRHESSEALAAIGSESSLAVLTKFLTDERAEVRETCELGIAALQWKAARRKAEGGAGSEGTSTNPFGTEDPAPPAEDTLDGNSLVHSTSDLADQLMDESRSIFDRYRAMFSLRNRGGKECVDALVRGFSSNSALMRHEIAYVLGQMQDPAATLGLKHVLEDLKEHPMVRHEAAEALGAIDNDAGGGVPLELLEGFKGDDAVVVAESCVVALDSMEYWKQFEAKMNNTSEEG